LGKSVPFPQCQEFSRSYSHHQTSNFCLQTQTDPVIVMNFKRSITEGNYPSCISFVISGCTSDLVSLFLNYNHPQPSSSTTILNCNQVSKIAILTG
jgi:hypothetical protein